MSSTSFSKFAPKWLEDFLAMMISVLPAFILFCWHASMYDGWLIDDAGISFAYARNLAVGHGLVSQAGFPPVEGFSNPLWTLLFSAIYSVGLLTIPTVPKIVSQVFVFGGFFAAAAAIRTLIKGANWPIVAGGALVLCSANPAFVIWSVSGLENPLMVFLGALLLYFCSGVFGQEVGNEVPLAWGAGLTAAALSLTRPDGLVYACAFPLVFLLWAPKSSSIKKKWSVIATYLGACGVPLVIYLVFRLSYYGDWLPNTYYAKPGTSASPLIDLVMMQGDGSAKFAELVRAMLPALPVLVPAIIYFGILKLRDRGKSGYPGYLHILTLMVSLGLFGYMVLPTDWMREFRFGTLPILFFYCLLFASVQWLLSGLPMRQVKATLLIAAIGLLFSYSYFDFRFRAERFAERPTAPLETVFRNFRPLEELAMRLGMKSPSILIPDLGATLMYSHFRVIDLAGLCDRGIGRMMSQRASPAELSSYILEKRQPDFVHLQGWWIYRSGLKENPAFGSNYISLGDGNYFRRAALPKGLTDQDVLNLYTRIIQSPAKARSPDMRF